MSLRDLKKEYGAHVDSLLSTHSREEAMALAVGGEFEKLGVLEREFLIGCGLKPEQYLIDVGCGSGRLAKSLTEYLHGAYLGIDVVPALVEYARQFCSKPNWRFEVTSGFTIPEGDEKADMVCFFSVFTHLRHEGSYRYLREALRVLRGGGKIVFSFLEFKLESHWQLFENEVILSDAERVPVQFMSRDGIEAWAARLDCDVKAVFDGDKPYIEIPNPIILSDGRRLEKEATFGQSGCILVKRQP